MTRLLSRLSIGYQIGIIAAAAQKIGDVVKLKIGRAHV